jgi:hypothetical protein
MPFIELLVFVIVGFEALSRLWRQRVVAKRAAATFYAFAEGQQLQKTVPPASESAVVIAKWKNAQRMWVIYTKQLLQSYSASAEVCFNHEPRAVIAPPCGISAPAEYEALVVRLNNLRNILENPGSYF